MSLKERIYRFMERIARRERLSAVDESLQLKRSISIVDELGSRPVNVSVVIPTFLRDPSELSGYRYEVLRNELVVLGQLLTRGLIDEIIIVDGSRARRAELDERLVGQIILSAYRSIPLFHDQVDLLNRFPALKDKAKLGFYDFVLKVVHQLDPQISMAMRKLGIFFNAPVGKGVGLWLGVGASSGDVMVFLDSDIRNLEGWQVAALIKPILRTFKDKKSKVEFVKAYYARLSVNLDSPERGFYKLGGRVTRLFMIPMLRVLAKRGILKGLEKLRYPLSGEFAGKRSFIESLSFPMDYGVETGMLVEIWRRGEVDKLVEVDLNLFQHFPRDEGSVIKMIKEINNLLFYELKDRIELDEGMVNEYLREAYKEVNKTQDLFEKAEIKVEVSHKVRRAFYKDVEGDKKRVENYAKILKETAASLSKGEVKPINKLPPWRELTKTLSGQNFQNLLRKRAVAYTLNLLSKRGIISLD